MKHVIFFAVVGAKTFGFGEAKNLSPLLRLPRARANDSSPLHVLLREIANDAGRAA